MSLIPADAHCEIFADAIIPVNRIYLCFYSPQTRHISQYGVDWAEGSREKSLAYLDAMVLKALAQESEPVHWILYPILGNQQGHRF